jgi:uncharacterized caspase-like protein
MRQARVIDSLLTTLVARLVRTLAVCAGAFVLAICASASAQSLSADPEVVPRPEWTIGDWWEYQNAANTWRLTVVAKRADGYTVAQSRAGERIHDWTGRTTYLFDLDGWATTNIDAARKSTPAADKRDYVKFPLKVGGRWFFYAMTTRVGSPQTELRMYNFDCRAEGWETLDIGGRSVRAIKIAISQRERGVNYGGGLTAWYAPEAKRIVRLVATYTGGPSVNMIAFGSATDAPPVVTTGPSAPPATSVSTIELKGPPGAMVSVDGRPYRLGNDGAASVTLRAGTHEITASHDAYEPWRATVVIDGRQPRLPYTIAMTLLKPPIVRRPPAITLLDPKPGTLLHTPETTLKIEVKSDNGLKSLAVKGRGVDKTFAPEAGAKAGEPWIVETKVALGEGSNVVQIEAVDDLGGRAVETVHLARQSLITIDFEGPPLTTVRVDQDQHALDVNGRLTLQLAPGRYQIDATKDGFSAFRESVTLSPGQPRTRKTLALAPLPAPPPARAAPPADTEAPKIAINYPTADTQVASDAIVILGLVTDNVAVDRVQITVNGVEIPQPRDLAVVGRGVPIRVPAALQPGANVIEIIAADKAGNVSQLVRTVTRLAPAAPMAKVGNRWAVVIGVGEYENRAIPTLRFATRDADAMYQFLTTQGGYPKDHVLLLTDTSPQKPTLLNIKRALGDFLARRAARDDMVLIYFAGHGAPEIDAGGTEADGLSKYLVPRDGDPESLYTTALPMDEIQRIFARVQAERVVMLLDTCYSGNAGGRTFARASVRASGLNDQFLERLTRSRGRVIITASGPNEVALEIPSLGHGLFTYYVLEGLRGKADRNGDGIVTVSELYEYVEDQVDTAARRAGGRQRPLMKGEIEGSLPLSRIAR